MLNHPLINIDDIAAQTLQQNLADFTVRTEGGLALLAEGCGMVPDDALTRFRWIKEQLAHESEPEGLGNIFAQFTTMIGQALPDIFELVMTYRGKGLSGIGYLTQGPSGPSLSTNLGEMLRGSLQVFLATGGDAEEAALLAALFRIAFPDLSALADFSPLAQGMVVGFVPSGTRTQIKAYFNTRLGRAGEHREQVKAMLSRIGVTGPDVGAVYDTLYDRKLGARFHGVGCDLDGDGTARAKVYVRVDAAQALGHLSAVANFLGIEVDTSLLERHFDPESLADEIEIAVALESDGPPTIKLTLFFPPKAEIVSATDRIAAYLDEVGYDAALLSQMVKVLEAKTGEGTMRTFPVHGLGVEFPDGERRKVNLYLQAAI